ncbi:MAG: hemolysin [Actinomycetota bacterium]|nr:hemolysin [Actinomycetota bacterium]
MSNDLAPSARPGTGTGFDEPSPAQVVVDAITPVLRGWLHLVCFFLSIPAGMLVIASAHTPLARTSAVIYAIGVSALFGVSALYHRREWSVTARPRMKRVDHATIFVMIAATYTPLCLVALGGALGTVVFVVVWACAVTGVIFAATGIAEKAIVGLAMYIGLGWGMALVFPQLTRVLSSGQLALVVAGGVLYTVGGIFLGTRWPDPFPAIFGYHELWHLMVVAAAACHYVVILAVVKAAMS